MAGWIRRSLLWLQAQMLGIVVGMDQKDSFYVHKPVVIAQVQFLDRLSLRLLVKPAAIPQVQFLDKVICPWWNDRFDGLDGAEKCRVPTGAVLGRFGPDSAETRDDSTVAVLGQGCGHACCSWVQTCRKL